MRTLVALLLAAAAACAIARPPAAPMESQDYKASERSEDDDDGINQQFFSNDYYAQVFLPKIVLPDMLDNGEYPPQSPEDAYDNNKDDFLNYNQIKREYELTHPARVDVERWLVSHRNDEYQDPEIVGAQADFLADEFPAADYTLVELPNDSPIPRILINSEIDQLPPKRSSPEDTKIESNKPKSVFAYTPFDKEYYAPVKTLHHAKTIRHDMNHYELSDAYGKVIEAPRQIRQNPNLHKQKNLLGPEVSKLKSGFAQVEGGRDERGETENQGPIHSLEMGADPADSIYGVALIAAVGTALTMVIVGFVFGWYTLTRKAKAAADVDYPAYGVTGPTIDSSADRKLAQSAHMYHYQHQKQQIIAMERNGLEQRNGSISDPESEEENEEGDYTVYECPGLATTGDMEVKNPMFSEDPTPATPGKTETVKVQPKE